MLNLYEQISIEGRGTNCLLEMSDQGAGGMITAGLVE